MKAGVVATISLSCGLSLLIVGVFLLAGVGWALVCAAVPFIVLAVVLFRGLINAEAG